MTAFSKDRFTTISQKVSRTDEIVLGPNDILCGRCKMSFNHVGNQHFRATISLNLHQYLDARSRHEKSAIIVSLVRMLRNESGTRFLKNTKQGLVELSEKQAREKVGHALRDMAVAKQQSTMTERTEKQREEQQSTKLLDEGANHLDIFQSLQSLVPPVSSNIEEEATQQPTMKWAENQRQEKQPTKAVDDHETNDLDFFQNNIQRLLGSVGHNNKDDESPLSIEPLPAFAACNNESPLPIEPSPPFEVWNDFEPLPL
jgi:hypothetical protein